MLTIEISEEIMSLTASLWTSVSGLLAHGEKMNVVGNNISNVNTVGYKSQRMDFQDFVYQYVGTAAGTGQVGRGTNIGIVINDYSQGSLETTTGSTDIAIEGNGFFSVKPLTTDVNYYTRAGNFTFNREGYLVDPHGYALQGWAIDPNQADQLISTRTSNGIIGSGSPVDIQLDTFTCPPHHTNNITLPVNLRKASAPAEDDKSSDAVDPFFALLKTWDAQQNPPIGSSKYAHQSTMDVYDEAGKLHKITVYFDRVANGHANQKISGNTDGESYWEYVVTMDPTEDVRDFTSEYHPEGGAATYPNVPEKLKGLLGAGTFTFTSSGQMKDMSFFVPHAEPGIDPNTNLPVDGAWWDSNGNVDLDKWVAGPFSSSGYPMIAPNFSGTAGLQTAYEDGVWTVPNANAADRMISLNMGLKNTSASWTFMKSEATILMNGGAPVTDPDGVPVYDPASMAGDTYPAVPRLDANGAPVLDSMGNPIMDPDPRLVPALGPDGLVRASDIRSSKYHANGEDGFAEVQTNSTTCLGDSFYEKNGARQDGYTYGDLRTVDVSKEGVLSASYSNGVTLQLYQIVLYDFPSKQNLRREGGNLFTETRESGPPSSGAAGTGSFGTTKGYSIEQSNTDLSREFVNMITTQRGFQANSKTITTVDTMLETVISMKR